MKQLMISLSLALVIALAGLAVHHVTADATKRLPTFAMKDLEEVEHNLSDAEFKDKRLLIAGIGTWQQVSRDQAAELEAFHKAHPDVEIICFIADDITAARDFVKTQGITYKCYKADGTAPINATFNRLFETKKGKTLTLNQLPFVVLAGKDRSVYFAETGVVKAVRLGEVLK
ncbi:MAG: redoxin domain-containing protein [Planctomycetes bacterium]|nr:redoxin domain-containing protein [Planctomycetota bacterium]